MLRVVLLLSISDESLLVESVSVESLWVKSVSVPNIIMYIIVYAQHFINAAAFSL